MACVFVPKTLRGFRYLSVIKVLHRLLSLILKREDDYIETSLIVEKVRLTVKCFLYKSIWGFFRTPSIPFFSFLSRFNVIIKIKL